MWIYLLCFYMALSENHSYAIPLTYYIPRMFVMNIDNME